MTAVTLYDGQTGEVIGDGAGTAPEPVVAVEDLSKVSLAVDPRAGRAFAQLVVDPGERRVVADLVPDEDDTLSDLHRAVAERIDASVLSVAPPGGVPAHLNVFGYLPSADAYVPDPEIGGHLVSTEDTLQVGVPDAATAARVVSFLRGRAPWKVVAVQAAGGGVSTDDADVVVTVDQRFDGVTWHGRDESWVDEDALPENIDIEADDAADGTDEAPDPGVGERSEDVRAAVRLFDGDTGELLAADGARTDAPEGASEAARRRYAGDQMLVVAPADGVVVATLATTDDGDDRGFLVEYEHGEATDDLLASFAASLSDRAGDLGTTVGVDVGDAVVGLGQLAGTPSRPDRLGDADVAYLGRSDAPIDFAAPDGPTAVELATYLLGHLEGDPSVAVSGAGRTEELAAVDVVVAVDPECEGVEPRGETTTRLADGRLREGLTEVGGAVQAVADRVGEITGTEEARQRVFAAAVSGEGLAARGLTVAPVDDDPLARRRRQARYLALYGLVVVGVALGVNAGQFAPLVALLGASYPVDLGSLAGTPAAPLAGEYAVGGVAAVGLCLAALVAGAYWLVGYPMGPVTAARTLAGRVRKQVTGGAGSGTVPTSVAEVAEPVDGAVEELEAGYERLGDVEGSVAGDAEDFATFLEANLLTGAGLPEVTVVDREERRRRLLAGMAVGAVVGTISGVAVLSGLWLVTVVAARDPTVVFEGLAAAVGLVLLAALVRVTLVEYTDVLPR